ncbi:MAG TPA: hypothetical protein VH482_23685 [Thermomicrobiales bacterium]|jgi:hypothetical protein
MFGRGGSKTAVQHWIEQNVREPDLRDWLIANYSGSGSNWSPEKSDLDRRIYQRYGARAIIPNMICYMVAGGSVHANHFLGQPIASYGVSRSAVQDVLAFKRSVTANRHHFADQFETAYRKSGVPGPGAHSEASDAVDKLSRLIDSCLEGYI